jgi:hypothetical protein
MGTHLLTAGDPVNRVVHGGNYCSGVIGAGLRPS